MTYRDQDLQAHCFAAAVDFTLHMIKNDKQYSVMKCLPLFILSFVTQIYGLANYAIAYVLSRHSNARPENIVKIAPAKKSS